MSGADTVADDIRAGRAFDSRDVCERIEQLDRTLDADGENGTEDSEDRDEHTFLVDVAKGAEDASEDWEYGAYFIPEADFEDHARELADSIGAVDAQAGWPTSYIDWPAAADALKSDYTTLEIDGTTYYVR